MKTRNEAVVAASSLWQYLMIRDQNLIMDIQSYHDYIQLTAFFNEDEKAAHNLYETILSLEMSHDSMRIDKLDCTGYYVLKAKISFEYN